MIIDPRERVQNMRWFHAIDFGGFGSSGRFPKGTPQNSTLYGTFEMLQAMDLRDATVLDLGTMDGIVAFGVKTLGAGTSPFVLLESFSDSVTETSNTFQKSR